MILAECKQLLDFLVVSKSTLRKECKKLGFCYKRCSATVSVSKKKKMYQKFDADIVPPPCNFIKSETIAQGFSCKISKNVNST